MFSKPLEKGCVQTVGSRAMTRALGGLRTKGGHILDLTSSREAWVAALSTQRPKVTTKDGLKLKLTN